MSPVAISASQKRRHRRQVDVDVRHAHASDKVTFCILRTQHACMSCACIGQGNILHYEDTSCMHVSVHVDTTCMHVSVHADTTCMHVSLPTLDFCRQLKFQSELVS
jgi:spore coat protein U-like protein